MFVMLSFVFLSVASAVDPPKDDLVTGASSASKKDEKTVSSTVLISVPCPSTAEPDDKVRWKEGVCNDAENHLQWSSWTRSQSEGFGIIYDYPHSPTTAIEACNMFRQHVLDMTAKWDAEKKVSEKVKAPEKVKVLPSPASSSRSLACTMCRDAWNDICARGGYDGTDMCTQLQQSNCADACGTFY